MLLASVLVVGLGGALLIRHRASERARRLLAQLRQGGAVLASPRRYATEVALPQAAAWGCRLGVVFALLHAFHIAASPAVALAVLVLGGASSAVAVLPGGAGAQQIMVVYALRATASATAALSFSLGMQVGVTAFNAILGLAGARTAVPYASSDRSAARQPQRGSVGGLSGGPRVQAGSSTGSAT